MLAPVYKITPDQVQKATVTVTVTRASYFYERNKIRYAEAAATAEERKHTDVCLRALRKGKKKYVTRFSHTDHN
jgi:hypothetical protein